ncbi:hypothetical protein MTsDn5_27650 [Alteromonas gracilis]|jgi:hypothetical protein|uniref:Uncharacterized protein n=1 Tax=Alteromonas gracilis TaxID=1479524 RepID=A0ABX5CW74_9ALTE|nr:hypothetical protein [Alteromonas gracilis]PRO70815.1 hypothetical protein C6Y39_00215 [Alteromonas gracilis]
MTSKESNEKTTDRSLGNFAAVKTSIANGDAEEVKARLEGNALDKLEKDYLIDLARLSGNAEMVGIIEAVPVSD